MQGRKQERKIKKGVERFVRTINSCLLLKKMKYEDFLLSKKEKVHIPLQKRGLIYLAWILLLWLHL